MMENKKLTKSTLQKRTRIEYRVYLNQLDIKHGFLEYP